MKRTVKNMLLDGGSFCFDFTNTVHSRKDEATYDYLNSYIDIIDWGERVKLLPKERLSKLKDYAQEHKKEAELKLNEIISKRELLYKIFSALAHDKSLTEKETESFNDSLSDSLSNIRLKIGRAGINVAWRETEIDLMEPLWAVYKDAYDIITTAQLNRIKECKACGWVFMDKSKNNSRTWCNMQTCGSIDKAKRYYHNTKKKKGK